MHSQKLSRGHAVSWLSIILTELELQHAKLRAAPSDYIRHEVAPEYGARVEAVRLAIRALSAPVRKEVRS